MRYRLRKIADGLVASVEKPVVDSGALAGETDQHRSGHHLSRLAAGKKVNRPRGVARIRRGKIALQRRDLRVGGRGRIEFGE